MTDLSSSARSKAAPDWWSSPVPSGALVELGSTVAVVNQKGGTGKSTTVISFAAAVAEALRDIRERLAAQAGISVKPVRVRMLDGDPQAGSITYWLPPQWHDVAEAERYTMLDVLRGRVTLDAATWPTMVPGLYIVPSFKNLIEFEHAADITGRDMVLLDALGQSDECDLDMIDCSPSLGQLTATLLVAAERLFIPVRVGGMDMEGVADLNRTIAAVRRIRRDQVTSAVIVTAMLRSDLTDQVISRLVADFQDEALLAWIRHTVRVQEAPHAHEPVTTFAADSTATADYRQLAKMVMPVLMETGG